MLMDLQYFKNYYDHFPILIQLVWCLIGIMSLCIALLTVYLKLIRSSLRNKREETFKFKSKYEALLIEYLYSGNEAGKMNDVQESIILRLKDHVINKSHRKIIISILYDLMNEVSGEMSESIKALYFKTGLIDFALTRLKSKNWYVIAKSIGEFRRFSIEKVHSDVVKFIKHPRREVRKEAQLYLVNLFRFEGLSFLNEQITPLSEWEQVQLLEVLQKFDDQQICDIKPWLKSTNNTVVLFALKLAQIYNQFEVKDTLMELLSHNDKNIRILTIEVLTSLYGIEAKEMLKTNFNQLSTEEQISFFRMLEHLVVPSDESFIEEHLFHKNFEVQLLALKILKTINLDKFLGINKLSQDKRTPEMLKFVTNI